MPTGLPNLYVQLDAAKVRPTMLSKAGAGGEGTVQVAADAPPQYDPRWHRVVSFEDDGETGIRVMTTGCGKTNEQDLVLDTSAPWQLTELAVEPPVARCDEGCFEKPKSRKKS